MTPSIRFDGGHLNDPPEYAIPLMTAIGFIIAHWARLEQQIDILLISINKEHHSTEKYRPTPNTSFRLKCDLFERWFVKDPRFSEHRDKAKRLLRSFKELSFDRTLVAHSSIQEFREGPPPIIVLRNLKIEGEGEGSRITISRAEITEAQLLQAGRGISGINRGLSTIAKKVLTPAFLESLERP